MNKWIILDRDGVINYDSNEYIKSPDEWIPIPGSLEALVKLNQAGYHVVVATNQSGVGRGLYSEATLIAIHNKMQKALAELGGSLEGIFYCPHTPTDNCNCRKPKPGLFTLIANQFKLDLTNLFAIGDKLSDIQAAQAVGCKPILVLTGKGENTLASNSDYFATAKIPIFANLAEATSFVISNNYAQ